MSVSGAVDRDVYRKTVTVLFSDLVDSTPLGEDLDPESLRRVMGRWHEAMRTPLEQHGGTIEKFVGDAVMAVFGIPVAHEDDALRAVRAAIEMRTALSALNAALEEEYGVQLRSRTGLNTGEVVTGAGETLVTGDAVHIAARLEQRAGPGEILLGEETARLVGEAAVVEPLGELALKGKSEPCHAWRLLKIRPKPSGLSRSSAAPFVGRVPELGLLRERFEASVAEAECELVSVVGAAGIGKSRLIGELVAAVGERARVVSGRCIPYGEGMTYSPLVEIVRELGEDPHGAIAEALAGEESELAGELVAAAVGDSQRPATSDEINWAVRKLFEGLARTQPLVVVFEDLHWAEPTFLDLVEYVAGFSTGRPIMLLVSARPEVLEMRPGWGRPGPRSNLLYLSALDDRETDALIDALLSGRGSLPERRRLIQAAEGNPLFVEQLLAMNADKGEGDLEVPPQLRALLAARVDRLDPAEREVIVRASVAGRDFQRGAVAELMPENERSEVGPRLLALVRKEMIRPGRSELPGDDGFRFVHMLVRDAAYESMPKDLRASLHERYASWLEQVSSQRALEQEEIVGFHLEQAHGYRSELGRVQADDPALAQRASALLGGAGRRAYVRGDLSAAVALFVRATTLLDPSERERLELNVELGEALRDRGDFEQADAVLSEVIRLADDPLLEKRSLLIRLRLRLFTDPQVAEEAEREARRVVDGFSSAGDERLLAEAWELLAWAPWSRCQAQATDEALRHAIEHARRAGDTLTEAHGLSLLCGVALLGPMPVVEAISLCEQIRSQPDQQRRIIASALRALAGLKAMAGDFVEARELLARHRALLQELGLRVTEASAAETYGVVELLAGDPVAAERELLHGYEILEEIGETNHLPYLAGKLAEALEVQGREQEAERYTRVCEQAAAEEDLVAQIQWRTIRARISLRDGVFPEAERFAREALDLAEETDFPTLCGDAALVLAQVLKAHGRGQGAAAAAAEALDAYQRKGNIVSAEEARLMLASLEADATQ